MIIRKRENWIRMLFVWRGSVVSKILPRLFLLALFSVLIYRYHGFLFSYKIALNPAAFTLVGIALAIFLGFCNTAAYERYWEGRKLWGALMIDTRSVVRQVLAYSKADYQQKAEFVQLAIAFTYALKHQLRKTDPSEDIHRLLPNALAVELIKGQFIPVLILKEMAQWLDYQQQQGYIDSITKMGIDQNLDKLSAIVGGCERISNTPIPFPYHVLLHRTVYIYCFMLPFGLVDSIGWMTPVMVTFIAYTFMALDAIVEEISEPFGTEPNDLALNTMCLMVECSLSEMAGLPLPSYVPSQGAVID
ncbi:bestrophin family ion channel [Runella sp. MFBS21]|uniref:bestrophin family protein n=1 Tax=Runella sp. MFBS21 TaxID=3034018 RepID=UPI0023F709E2|nr:bestrophin family ion channel [Runella sp. MFBS21]MDF7819977.1 bestrophin family ion channel [Runella sp. MFBS21]